MATTTVQTSTGQAIEGFRFIDTPSFEDPRGHFTKIFGADHRTGSVGFKEVFWSQSARGVIRGMHVQLPPADGGKLVWVVGGTVVDVALDLRSQSSSFGAWNAVKLQSRCGAVYLPPGVAHGFEVLSSTATVCYAQECEYDPMLDTGVLFDSFGYQWITAEPLLSKRDLSLMPLSKWMDEANA